LLIGLDLSAKFAFTNPASKEFAMSPAWILAAVALAPPLIYFAARLFGCRQTLRNLDDAICDLHEELRAVRRGSLTRYNTPMPAKQGFDDERWCSEQLMPNLLQAQTKLHAASFRTKLTRAWRLECRGLMFKARMKIRSLEEEAFWAQFPPGSVAAESRYNGEPELE
jgi:hypothetical protein